MTHYDGRLMPTPTEHIAPTFDVRIRNHREPVVAPTICDPVRLMQDEVFAAWMKADDERRRATMAAGKARRHADDDESLSTPLPLEPGKITTLVGGAGLELAAWPVPSLSPTEAARILRSAGRPRTWRG